jgi:hypothetical protein
LRVPTRVVSVLGLCGRFDGPYDGRRCARGEPRRCARSVISASSTSWSTLSRISLKVSLRRRADERLAEILTCAKTLDEGSAGNRETSSSDDPLHDALEAALVLTESGRQVDASPERFDEEPPGSNWLLSLPKPPASCCKDLGPES